MLPERVKPIVDKAGAIAKLFRANDIPIYLVGGSVRDAVISRDQVAEIPDFDYTTPARPELIEKILSPWADALWTQGKKFGTIACIKDGIRHEVTTFRSETYDPDSRKPEVSFGNSLEEDLSRRDFTVNAMALSLPDLELIDPFNGIGDLGALRLATPLSPEISFSDDPLRMMRAARFIASLDLTPDEALTEAVGKMASRIEVVSAERTRDELNRLVTLPNPEKGLWFLVNTGLAEHFLPELPALALEQDPIHRHKDVLGHTIAVVCKTQPNLILRLAALFHDVGKPKTRSYENDKVQFHFHDVVGARMTKKRMSALRYPTSDIESVTKLVELHLRFHTYKLGWTDKALRRYARDAGSLLSELNELTRCDCTTRNEKKAKELSDRIDEMEVRLSALSEKEELASLRPDLDGDEVMELLGLSPSREVGVAMNWLMDLRLDEGPLDKDIVKSRLLEWWRSRNSGEAET